MDRAGHRVSLRAAPFLGALQIAAAVGPVVEAARDDIKVCIVGVGNRIPIQMKLFYILLLGVLLGFASVAQASAPPSDPGTCCHAEECMPAPCAEAGCIAGNCAIPAPDLATWHGNAQGSALAVAPAVPLMDWFSEVWTPPD